MRATWDVLKYSLRVMSHPFDGFWDLKYEKKQGKMSAAMLILALGVLSFIIERQYTGFVIMGYQATSINVLEVAASLLLPFFLWCASNWALTTLFDGEGSFKDIIVASAFALIPIVLTTIPMVIISNIIVIDEIKLLNLAKDITYLFAGFLLITGTITTHQYTLLKTLIIIVAIVIGMALILFIGLLFLLLIQQMYNFLYIFIEELKLRY